MDALDRILQDERVHIEAFTGTSSGAVNAALAAYGLTEGGREGARALLESFWRELSRAFRERPWSKVSLVRTLLALRGGPLTQRAFLELMGRLASPYRLDPETMDPIRSVIGQHIDFEKLRADSSVKLFVNATDVRTGDVRIFDRSEMSPDASGSPSKLNPDWESLERTRDRGYEAADRWLAEHFDDIGRRSTADLQSLALASPEMTGRRS